MITHETTLAETTAEMAAGGGHVCPVWVARLLASPLRRLFDEVDETARATYASVTFETLVVDEAAEMRQIRREELAMDRKGADEATEGEFVCTSCFLVLKTSQLADGRRKICRDCAA